MEHTYTLEEKLYQHLGAVFYCIAAVDKKVNTEEVAALKKIVREEWTSGSVAKTGYEIETVFDWLNENGVNQSTAMADFEQFIKDHRPLFTPEINHLIMKTAHAIANSFNRKNKGELVLLTHLQFIINKTVL